MPVIIIPQMKENINDKCYQLGKIFYHSEPKVKNLRDDKYIFTKSEIHVIVIGRQGGIQ